VKIPKELAPFDCAVADALIVDALNVNAFNVDKKKVRLLSTLLGANVARTGRTRDIES